ncbi:hypothetical protein F6455_01105 [Proteobacteria bacterium 005FR1]|nr:hypothetical protein [Proteobacteria bacterium 005FR1]
MEGSGRCSCGSGRLFKNCCKNKPRLAIEIDLDGENERFDGVAISQHGVMSGVKKGRLFPLVGCNRVAYRNADSDRKKILSVTSSSDSPLTLDPNSALAEFPTILIVDTNTKRDFVGGNKVSISSLIHCVTEKVEANTVFLKYSLVGAWEFWNLEGNEEQYFWKALAESIETGSAHEIYQVEKVGILTDCNVNRHPDFNAKRAPIYGEYYLPERFTLFYASSDSARDLPNKLIRKCDAFSSKVMKAVVHEEVPPRVEGMPFSHLRQWHPDDDDTSWQIDGYESLPVDSLNI